MYVTGVFLLLLSAKIFAYNIDTNHFIVYVDPERNISNPNYFGYTVLLYPGKNGLGKWVKIGAPKGQDPALKDKFPNSGVVYNCPFMEKCSPMDIQQGYTKRDESLENAWLGGSMDINYKFQTIAICAFRNRKTVQLSGTHYNLIGSCYSAYINDTFDELTPLSDNPFIKNALYPTTIYYYGQGQAGFSVHLPEEENAVILGAPGVYNWAGTLVKVIYRNESGPIASRLRSRRDTRDIYIADPKTSSFSFQYELFGYSTTSGYYFEGSKLYYVATSPKYPYYIGKATAVQFNENKPLIEKTSVVGRQFGEYFGASSTSGDLNSDGFDDLIIGAPYHVTETYNEGATYIFLGRSQGQFREQQPLYGQTTNGQFGTSVMFLGDINNDGFGDLAIGAPYELELSGVLYIYKGNRDGVDKKPCQRIVGKDIAPQIRGFGISISRPADIDENGYKDLMVGAHLSGNAVLLRTNPTVVIHYSMQSIPKVLQQSTKEFLLNICYKYTHFQNATLEVMTRTIVVDEILGRASLKNGRDKTKTIIIKMNTYECENVTVLLNNIQRNYMAPVTFSLSYKLVEPEKEKEVMYISQKYKNGSDTFCVRCPVLDKYRSDPASSINVPFTLDCGADDICQSSLMIKSSFSGLRENSAFLVGSQDYLNLNVVIENSGEHAYSTQLEITLPDLIRFRQIPSECSEQNVSVIICSVDIIRTGAQKSVTTNLDMKKINRDNMNTKVKILLRVLTTSFNSNPNQKEITLKLERDARITITGKSEQQSVPFGKNITRNPNFTQKYQVESKGVSPVERVLVNIKIPHTIRTQSGNITFIRVFRSDHTFAGQLLSCQSDIDYIAEQKFVGQGEMLSDNIMKRRKREVVEVFKDVKGKKKEDIVIDGKDYNLMPDRMLYLNCSTKDVVCSSIVCSIGPFENKQSLAEIKIKMMLDIKAASRAFEGKDIIFFATQGALNIEIPSYFILKENRTDFEDVGTKFISETIQPTKIALWIIILAVILGILLLALIIYGLTKVGFFKRADKEKLKSLKAEAKEVEAQSNPEPVMEEVDGEEPVLTLSSGSLVEQNHGVNASTEGLVDG